MDYPKCELPQYEHSTKRECGNCYKSGNVVLYFSIPANCWGYSCYCSKYNQNVEGRYGGCDDFKLKQSLIKKTIIENKPKQYFSSVIEMREQKKVGE